jgi:hypothetical protein
MKNMIFLCLGLVSLTLFYSCSKEENELNSNYSSYYQNGNLNGLLPEPGFLDEYRDSLHTNFSLEELESCDCSDLLAHQTWRDNNFGNFFPNYMPKTPLPCSNLPSYCSFDSIALLNLALDNIDSLEANNIISSDENSVLTAFFTEIMTQTDTYVDFSSYRQQLDNADTEGVLSQAYAGLASHYLLTVFEDQYNYYSTFTGMHEDDDPTVVARRIPRWVRLGGGWLIGNLAWEGVKKVGGAIVTAINHPDPESTQFGIDVFDRLSCGLI